MSTKTERTQKTTSRTNRARAQSRRFARFSRRVGTKLWQMLRQLLIWLCGWLIALGRRCWSTVTQLYMHVVSPALCFICVYAGVLLTMALPTSMWSWLALPVAAHFIEILPRAFPLADLPTWDTLVRAMVSALPIAVLVFRRAYPEWKSSQEVLVAKMLYACHAGVAWPKIWFHGRQPPTAHA